MTIFRALGTSASVLTLVSVLACSEGAVPTDSNGLQHAIVVGPPPGSPGQPTPETITLCKVGSGADFNVTSATSAGTTTSTQHLSDGACIIVSIKPRKGTFGGSVTETSSDPGFYLDHIDVTTIADKNAAPVTTTLTGTSSVSAAANAFRGTAGVTWTFYNMPVGP